MCEINIYDVGLGDMFSVKKNNDDVLVIDCNLNENEADNRLREMGLIRKNLSFLSTHYHEDHFLGLKKLIGHNYFEQFLYIEDSIKMSSNSIDEKEYKKQINSPDSRKLEMGDHIGRFYIDVIWPNKKNPEYNAAVQNDDVNNLSPIIKLYIQDEITMYWFGDISKEMLGKIYSEIENDLTEGDIVVLPHHGFDSGELPEEYVNRIKPKLFILNGVDDRTHKTASMFGKENIKKVESGDIKLTLVDIGINVFVKNKSFSHKNYSCMVHINTPAPVGYYYLGTICKNPELVKCAQNWLYMQKHR